MSSSDFDIYIRIQQQHCHESGSPKWFLYTSKDGVSNELVRSYTYLHHARQRAVKAAVGFNSFHLVVINADDVILEQHSHGSKDQPDLFVQPAETAEQPQEAKLYQKTAFRVVRHAPDLYTVDYQTWVSGNKDLLHTSHYDHRIIGDFSSRYLAVEAAKRAAAPFSAYSLSYAAYKGCDTALTVYQTEHVGTIEDGWFDISVSGALSAATLGDGGNAAPPSNTGGLNKESLGPLPHLFEVPPESVPDIQVSETYSHQYFENGVLKELMLRRGIDSPAFIDTLSFTFQSEFFAHVDEDTGDWVDSGDRVVMRSIVAVVEAMGLNACKEISGRNGYSFALQFGDSENGRNFGFVAWGGETQNGTVMFHFTGEGLICAAVGWESRLYALLKHLGSAAKITRIDISHDFLLGQYSIDQALADWQADCFTVRQTKPQAECQGTDWLSDTKKGRTFYIGSKRSSRILYFYEKGRQLGDEESPWVRLELRQRNKDYIIPFDVLLHPGDYLCSSYPYLSKILNYDYSEQCRFERIKKTNGVAIEHVVKYAKMQVSPAIKMLQSLGLNADDIIDKLLNKQAKMPKRLVIGPIRSKD